VRQCFGNFVNPWSMRLRANLTEELPVGVPGHR
jgi:hypothetical protein